MLTQFRVLYPQGSLISDLVKIDRGKYIVRASIEVNGVTLASGMAAAETVEQAEDRARIRALTLLNLNEPKIAARNSNNSEIVPKIADNTEPITNQSAKVKIADRNTVAKNASKTKVEPLSKQIQPSLEIVEKPSPAENIVEESILNSQTKEIEIPSKQSSFIVEPEPKLDLVIEPVENQLDIPPPEENEEPEPNLAIEDKDNSDTIELEYSEVIAQTDFEMKRLSWTKEEGRKYLQEHYGVRSRHSLDDNQLLEFLKYLKLQPDPV